MKKTIFLYYSFSMVLLCTLFSIEAKRPVTAPKQPNVDVTVTNDGHKFSFVNTQDVLCFVNRHSEDPFPGYDGLKNEKKIEALLEAQNYIEVLKHVWTEKDTNKKYVWLKNKALDNHVILMFELSKLCAALRQDDTAIHWLLVAITRTGLDISHCSDPSLGDASAFLAMNYGTYMQHIPNFASLGDTPLSDAVFLKILKEVKNFKKWPSPLWITYHGMRAFNPAAYGDALKPANERKLLHDKMLSQVEDEIQKIESRK